MKSAAWLCPFFIIKNEQFNQKKANPSIGHNLLTFC